MFLSAAIATRSSINSRDQPGRHQCDSVDPASRL